MLAKAVLLFVAFGWFANACPAPLLGDAVHYWASQGRDYQYLLLPPGSSPGADWYLPSFDHSSWLEGETIFANSTDLDRDWPFPIARTGWPTDTELFLFRSFLTKYPAEAPREMLAEIAVNGSYELYLNGALISAGSTTEPASHWNFTVRISPSHYHAGWNELGIRAIGQGETPAFDFAIWSIPEPATRWLFLLGFGVAPFVRRRRI